VQRIKKSSADLQKGNFDEASDIALQLTKALQGRLKKLAEVLVRARLHCFQELPHGGSGLLHEKQRLPRHLVVGKVELRGLDEGGGSQAGEYGLAHVLHTRPGGGAALEITQQLSLAVEHHLRKKCDESCVLWD
jgi:hypothetical protein